MEKRIGTFDRARQRGAIYLLVLFVVASTGAALGTLGHAWSLDAKRERETGLLWAGAQYRRAIARYYEATPGPIKTFPPTLESLLADPRFPETRRHLRQPLADPFTGASDWVTIAAPGGGIMGIASRSEESPLKRTGFEGHHRAFEDVSTRLKDRLRYRDWEFIHVPGTPAD